MDRDLLHSSWVAKSTADKVPEELAIEDTEVSRPHSIYRKVRINLQPKGCLLLRTYASGQRNEPRPLMPNEVSHLDSLLKNGCASD